MNEKIVAKSPSLFLSLGLVGVWLIGNIWTYQWFFDSLKNTSAVNLIGLAIFLVFIMVKLGRDYHFSFELKSPQFHWYPLILMLGGEITAIAVKWTIYLPQLTLSCFILGSYGLIGLFVSPLFWRKNLPLAILSAGIIPFAVVFQSGLGFPVRVITAHLVADILAFFHLGAISSHDIIVMENGIAQVDLPCSGMKSLWVGTMFLLGVTWLENRRIGWGWLLVAIANIFFLMSANALRVLCLVIAIEIWQQQAIAEVLHLPLGVIGFVFSGILTWILLQKVPHQLNSTASDMSKVNRLTANRFLSFMPTINLEQGKKYLLVILVIISFIGQIQISPSLSQNLEAINLPSDIVTENIPLSSVETNFFANPANPVVKKVRFQADNLAGSMLIVASNTWQAHHPPELCFVGNGFKVDQMSSTLINDHIHARWLSLQNGQLSATYWFQSAQETTDNFISRIWEEITHQHKTWVLVSILFDNAQNISDSEVQHFTQTLYQAIDSNLNPIA